MADDKPLPAIPPRYAPASLPTRASTPINVSLPSSSGAWFGTKSRIMRKDGEFIRQHADLLAAKTTQATQMRALIDARIDLALKYAELASLPDLIDHQYAKGHRERAHELRMMDIAHQTAETAAKTELAAALVRLAQFMPGPSGSATAPPAAGAGLTPNEVRKAAEMMPEMKPEAIETLMVMLSGMLAEKSK